MPGSAGRACTVGGIALRRITQGEQWMSNAHWFANNAHFQESDDSMYSDMAILGHCAQLSGQP